MVERLSSAPPAEPAPSLQGDLRASIEEILGVLAAVSEGRDAPHLQAQYDESHPVGALAASVNAMLDALAQARVRSAEYRQQLEDKIDAIERQQAAIRELSTPIIEVWRGVLCVPVVGMLDSSRTAEMTGALLSAVVEKEASIAIVDITGIQAMDTRAVDHFLRMARAVHLLGARCVLSGVHPNISQTIVHMGLDLQGIETHRSMSDALRQHARSASSRSHARAAAHLHQAKSTTHGPGARDKEGRA